MRDLIHADDQMIGQLIDRVLPPKEVEYLLTHFEGCAECTQRLERVEPALPEYRIWRDRLYAEMMPTEIQWPSLEDLKARAAQAETAENQPG